MEGKDKLASRQLHSALCTAYGPPGALDSKITPKSY